MQHVANQLGRSMSALLPLLACGSGDGRSPPPAGLDDEASPPSQLHDQTAVDPYRRGARRQLSELRRWASNVAVAPDFFRAVA